MIKKDKQIVFYYDTDHCYSFILPHEEYEQAKAFLSQSKFQGSFFINNDQINLSLVRCIKYLEPIL